LRHETSAAHRQLEAGMGFDLHKPDLDQALAMLRGFYAVLRVLEPAMLRLVPSSLAQGRAKLNLLHRDLLALGMSEPDITAVTSPGGWLPRSHAAALGALYVMEGSTLGGKLIVKALRRLPEWPIEGQCYFDPYGGETGTMWKSFQLYLDGVPKADGDEVVDAADRTFALLHDWMVSKEAR
jgi:heme oxygenase